MFESFVQWWDGLSKLLQTLYCIAIPSTFLLIIQTLISMFGMHDGGMGHNFSDTSGLDLDTDIDLSDSGGHGFFDFHHDAFDHDIDGGDPSDFSSMRLFTLQTVVAFLTVFSWSAIVLVGSGVFSPLAIFIGIVLGLVTMAIVAKIVQLSAKLTENGTINLKNAIGETAVVYIPCPPKNEGAGKVTVTIQGQLMEIGAINNSEEMLKTGTQVTIIDIRGDDVVIEKEQ